jgi:hypothetical protein
MKKLILFGALFFSLVTAYGQDKIFLAKGDSIVAKITEVMDNQIAYRYFNEPDGPVYKINKNSLVKIVYASGRIENYGNNNSGQPDVTTRLFGANKWREVTVAEYSQIIITYNAPEIEGLQNAGEVSGEGGGLTNEMAQQQAMRRLKKKAFALGAKVVLIAVSRSNYFGTWNYNGIAYK